MGISRGKVPRAQKVLIYGVEGIGKTTLAAQFPEPVFADTEGGTSHYDVARLEDTDTWQGLLAGVNYILDNPDCCKTLVIDTADWAEMMCIDKVGQEHHSQSILTLDYGKGSIYVADEWRKLQDLLDQVISKGIHVVLTAHALMKKYEQPDELGAYDRWELKLQSKQIKTMVKEWADTVLFYNYKTTVFEDQKTKSKKAAGAKRTIYTQHHASWDAKNRVGLPMEISLEEGANIEKMIKAIIGESAPVKTKVAEKPKPEAKEKAQKKEPEKKTTEKERKNAQEVVKERSRSTLNLDIPDELKRLMIRDNITDWDIQSAVASKGIYPSDKPITEYDEVFVKNALIGGWDKMLKIIHRLWETENIPF